MFTGLRPVSFNSGVKSERWEDTIRHGLSWLAAFLLLVHLMPETGCVGLLVTDLLSLLNVGHSRLDQLETAFSEGSPQLGSAVLEPDLQERKGARGCRCQFDHWCCKWEHVSVLNKKIKLPCVFMHLYSVLVQVQSVCQLLPQLDSWITVHLKHCLHHVHLGGNTDTRYWIQPSPCPKGFECTQWESFPQTDWLTDYLAVGEGGARSAPNVPVQRSVAL